MRNAIQADLKKPGVAEALKDFTWKLETEGFDYAVNNFSSELRKLVPAIKFEMVCYEDAKDKVLKLLGDYITEAVATQHLNPLEDLPVELLQEWGVLKR